MKTGITSIILALSGILFVIWFNYQISELIIADLIKMQSDLKLSPAIFKSDKLFKIIAIIIGLAGIIFGIKSLRTKKRIGIIGIVLSIILIILAFVPIWNFIISDSALDVNFF